MAIQTRAAIAALLLLCYGGAAVAQEGIPNAWTGGNGNWTDQQNWSEGGLPDAPSFGEYAAIDNGATVTVNSPITEMPGQVILGLTAEGSGSLVIANGGVLTTIDQNAPDFPTSGEVNVGYEGVGHLTVQPGGTLNVDTNLHVGGPEGSSATFGGVGPGATTVNIGLNANFNRDVRVVGPNVNLSALGLNLAGTSTFTAQITGPAHSAIKSTNLASLNGRLRLEISGVTPSAGSTWNLIDASGFAGQFTEIDASAAPALPFGQVYEFQTVAAPGSVNGMYGQVMVQQKLVLNVNRSTGAVSIATGPASVALDGYAIRSAHGSLNNAAWNSLQDQALSDWRESPPGGAVNQLSELKPTGSTTIASATPRALGNVFRYPNATEFGTEWEDLEFEYYAPDGKVTQGLINYTGVKRHNNLVLVIDPATGNAQIQNQSNLSVSIDGYKITSESGSLQPANGKWLSLDDNNREGGDWRESNPSVNQLAELKPSGSSQVPGGAIWGMGELFKTVGGAQDLVFEYLFPGEEEFRQGVVAYQALAAPSLAADFNDDNTVNAQDLTIWKGAFGTGPGGDADGDSDTDGADFLTWQRQFGQSITPVGSAATAIPEPGAAGLAVLAALVIAAGAGRRQA